MQSIIGKGTLAAGVFLVTSFRAKSRNLPCPAVIHVSVKMKIDVFVFRFPAVSRRPFMGLPERSLGCARDDETGSGWFLTRFQISAIHPLPSVCPSSTSSQRGGEECLKNCGERSSRIVSLPQAGNAIKLSGRTFLAPHRGSSPKGEARRYVANDFLNLITFPSGEGCDTRIPSSKKGGEAAT